MGLSARLGFHIRIYAAYALQNLKVKLAYPWDFFVNLIGTLAYGMLNITFLWVLLQKVPDIAGWTFPQLIFLYGMGEFCFGLFAIFFFHMVTRLSEYYIVDGHLDRLLVRPISPLMQLMMENLDMFDAVILLKGGALIGWAWWQMDLPFTLATVGALLLAFLIGTAVYLGIFLLLASVSFWMPDRGGMLMPLFSLSDVSRYPITVYPLGIRLLFSYVVPFAFTAFYPAVWVLEHGPLAWRVLLISLLVAGGALAAGITLFQVGLSRYESTGT